MKKLENFLKLFLVVAVLVLVYLIASLNITTEQTKNNIYDVLIGKPVQKSERKIFYLNPSKDDFYIEKDLSTIDWIEYKTKNYGVTFKYPSDFELIKDETRLTYKDGKKWDDIYFRSYNRKQKVGFSLMINPDGIGIPIDKKYKVVEEDGIKKVILEKDFSEEGLMKDGRMGLSAYWEYEGGWLQFIFSYQIDGELDEIDYEKMFKDIVKSFN